MTYLRSLELPFRSSFYFLGFSKLKLIFLTSSILLFFKASFAGGNGNKKDGKGPDTVKVLDLKGIFEKEPLTVPYLEDVADSLKEEERTDKAGLDQLSYYLESASASKGQILRMIDSLLDGGKIDRQRMRGIRILIARWRARKENPFMIPYGNEPYPASSLLEKWDTHNIVPFSNRKLGEREPKRRIRLVAPEWGCGFQVPVDGELTSSFGIRDGDQHAGVDIDLHTGDAVKSAFPGMVRISRYFKGYGKVVVIRHPNGLETLYAHLHRELIEPGERVEAGEQIGTGGNTGHSTGSHLHFEVRYQGVPLNPSHFISFDEGELLGDTLILKEKKRRQGIAAYPAGTRFHEVAYGDFLYKIAQRYGTSVHKLCELNGIHRNSTLWVGQKLRVSAR